MANATVVAGLADNCIATYQVTLATGTDVTNATLVTGVPTTNSPLYTFLSTVYANGAAAEVAFQALGGQVNIRLTSGTAALNPIATWTCTAAVPYLVFTGDADGVIELVVTAPHSLVK